MIYIILVAVLISLGLALGLIKLSYLYSSGKRRKNLKITSMDSWMKMSRLQRKEFDEDQKEKSMNRKKKLINLIRQEYQLIRRSRGK